MDIKYMLACIFMSMEPAKHERIVNVFVDFGSAKHGKIDVRLICRVTRKIMLESKVFDP